MEEYTTEEQQVEALKKWWKENGQSILTGIVLGIVIIVGVRWWNNQRLETADQASFAFSQLQNDLGADNVKAAEARAKGLIEDYGATAYAMFAALDQARLAVGKGDLEAARGQLAWVADHAKIAPVADIARLRLARLWLAEGKTDVAMEVLEQVQHKESLRSLYDEVKGDIYVAEGKTEEAKQAYKKAIAAAEPGALRGRIMQMKLEDLGGAEA